MSMMLFAVCAVAASLMHAYSPPPLEPDYKNAMRKVLLHAKCIVKQVNQNKDQDYT